MAYLSDRDFTDLVHSKLAITEIYDPIGWEIDTSIDPIELKRLDEEDGIDYILKDKKDNQISVQERFREKKYSYYNDFTMRYRRDNNPKFDRIESEFYKIKAQYFVYGVVNSKKVKEDRDSMTNFIKWAIIDLNFIRDKFDSNEIIIIKSDSNKSYIRENKLYCPENFNEDGSSSFIPLDIKLLNNIWPKSIYMQKGYF